MKPAAYLTHSAPGRCRLRIPAKRHDAEFFQFLEEKLVGTAGVDQVNTNPLAASILILYDEEHLRFDQLHTQLHQSEHFELTDQIHSLSVVETALQRIDSVDKLLRNSSSGQINFNAFLFIALVTMAVRQLQQGAVFGPASTLFWYALQILMKEKKN